MISRTLFPRATKSHVLTASVLRALTFWGNCYEETANSHAKQLFAALQSASIVPAAAAPPPHLLARYNPPFTLWFMKKNEVLIDIGALIGTETCDGATT